MQLDLAVVGAGVIGLSIARAAAQAGHSVAIFDRGDLSAASWAAGGILWPLRAWEYPDSLTQRVLQAAAGYADWVAGLEAETARNVGFEASGLVMVAQGEGEGATDAGIVTTATAWAQRWRQPLHILSPEQLRGRVPGRLSYDRHATGLYFPAVAQLRPPRLLAALRESLRRLNVPILTATEARTLNIERGRITGVRLADRRWVSARQLVLATGAWTPALLPSVHPAQAIRPVRGQMLLFAPPDKETAAPLSNLVLHQTRYVIPRTDGRVLVGSTTEDVGFDARTSESAQQTLYEFALTLFPDLAHRRVEARWAGLRPGSPEGIPWVERVAGCEGLIVAAGHHRYGITLAPDTASQVLSLLR